jgi:hypothetical protein
MNKKNDINRHSVKNKEIFFSKKSVNKKEKN